MRRLVQLLVALVFLGFAGFLLITRVEPVQDFVVHRTIHKVISKSQDGLFADDALRAVACGTSSPIADHDRASACVAVFAAGKFWVVDTGMGAWKNMALWRIPGENIGGILYTHYHSDHIAELGEFNLQTWGAGRPGQLQVYGPEGVERIVAGFTEAYALDDTYRTAHHGSVVMDPEKGKMVARRFDVDESKPEGTVILEENGLVIRAFNVDHKPIKPAVGYRFDYKGRSIAVSGDTVPSTSLIAASKGADVLFHEAQANFLVKIMQEEMVSLKKDQYSKILGDIPSYHTSPVDAAKVANEANVGLLVMYHLTPPPPNPIVERIFLRGVSDVRTDGIAIARDGFEVTLPANSKEILTSYLK